MISKPYFHELLDKLVGAANKKAIKSLQLVLCADQSGQNASQPMPIIDLKDPSKEVHHLKDKSWKDYKNRFCIEYSLQLRPVDATFETNRTWRPMASQLLSCSIWRDLPSMALHSLIRYALPRQRTKFDYDPATNESYLKRGNAIMYPISDGVILPDGKLAMISREKLKANDLMQWLPEDKKIFPTQEGVMLKLALLILDIKAPPEPVKYRAEQLYQMCCLGRPKVSQQQAFIGIIYGIFIGLVVELPQDSTTTPPSCSSSSLPTNVPFSVDYFKDVFAALAMKNIKAFPNLEGSMVDGRIVKYLMMERFESKVHEQFGVDAKHFKWNQVVIEENEEEEEEAVEEEGQLATSSSSSSSSSISSSSISSSSASSVEVDLPSAAYAAEATQVDPVASQEDSASASPAKTKEEEPPLPDKAKEVVAEPDEHWEDL